MSSGSFEVTRLSPSAGVPSPRRWRVLVGRTTGNREDVTRGMNTTNTGMNTTSSSSKSKADKSAEMSRRLRGNGLDATDMHADYMYFSPAVSRSSPIYAGCVATQSELSKTGRLETTADLAAAAITERAATVAGYRGPKGHAMSTETWAFGSPHVGAAGQLDDLIKLHDAFCGGNAQLAHHRGDGLAYRGFDPFRDEPTRNTRTGKSDHHETYSLTQAVPAGAASCGISEAERFNEATRGLNQTMFTAQSSAEQRRGKGKKQYFS